MLFVEIISCWQEINGINLHLDGYPWQKRNDYRKEKVSCYVMYFPLQDMKEEIKHLSAAAFLFKLLISIFSVLFHSASHTLYLYHHHTQVGGGSRFICCWRWIVGSVFSVRHSTTGWTWMKYVRDDKYQANFWKFSAVWDWLTGVNMRGEGDIFFF